MQGNCLNTSGRPSWETTTQTWSTVIRYHAFFLAFRKDALRLGCHLAAVLLPMMWRGGFIDVKRGAQLGSDHVIRRVWMNGLVSLTSAPSRMDGTRLDLLMEPPLKTQHHEVPHSLAILLSHFTFTPSSPHSLTKPFPCLATCPPDRPPSSSPAPRFVVSLTRSTICSQPLATRLSTPSSRLRPHPPRPTMRQR